MLRAFGGPLFAVPLCRCPLFAVSWGWQPWLPGGSKGEFEGEAWADAAPAKWTSGAADRRVRRSRRSLAAAVNLWVARRRSRSDGRAR